MLGGHVPPGSEPSSALLCTVARGHAIDAWVLITPWCKVMMNICRPQFYLILNSMR